MHKKPTCRFCLFLKQKKSIKIGKNCSGLSCYCKFFQPYKTKKCTGTCLKYVGPDCVIIDLVSRCFSTVQNELQFRVGTYYKSIFRAVRVIKSNRGAYLSNRVNECNYDETCVL